MKRRREKAGDRGQLRATQLYRVQVDASRQGQFVCDRCWPSAKDHNPHDGYGGT